MSMSYEQIRVTPLATQVGVEISGIDLTRPPGGIGRDPAGIGRIRGRVLPRPAADAGAAHRLRGRFWPDRRQPLLCRGAGLPDDRRGAQGTGPAAQYRQWLAHRPLV